MDRAAGLADTRGGPGVQVRVGDGCKRLVDSGKPGSQVVDLIVGSEYECLQCCPGHQRRWREEVDGEGGFSGEG